MREGEGLRPTCGYPGERRMSPKGFKGRLPENKLSMPGLGVLFGGVPFWRGYARSVTDSLWAVTGGVTHNAVHLKFFCGGPL